MKSFTYKVVPFVPNAAITMKGLERAAADYEAQLNQLGKDGWELVCRSDNMFFFKKEQ